MTLPLSTRSLWSQRETDLFLCDFQVLSPQPYLKIRLPWWCVPLQVRSFATTKSRPIEKKWCLRLNGSAKANRSMLWFPTERFLISTFSFWNLRRWNKNGAKFSRVDLKGHFLPAEKIHTPKYAELACHPRACFRRQGKGRLSVSKRAKRATWVADAPPPVLCSPMSPLAYRLLKQVPIPLGSLTLISLSRGRAVGKGPVPSTAEKKLSVRASLSAFP